MNSGSDNYEVIYYADDNEYRVYCDICDKLCFGRFYKNHSKSVTHTNNNDRRQQLNQMIPNNLLYPKICTEIVKFVII